MDAESIKPNQKRKYQRKVEPYNKRRVKQLAMQGLSCSTIAKDVGVHCSTITRYLSSIGLDNQQLEQYKKNRPDIKAFIGMKSEDVILKALETYDDNTISTMDNKTKNGLLMSLNAIVGTRHQEERLELDLSTSNVASVMADVAALRKLDEEPSR